MDSNAIAAGEEYMEHVGIRGMRWGVRRSRSARAAGASDYEVARELRKKKVKNLTNDELTTLNKRLGLESNYNKLNPSKSARRNATIEKHLKTIGVAQKVVSLALLTPQGKAAKEKGKIRLAEKVAKYTAKRAAKAAPKPWGAP